MAQVVRNAVASKKIPSFVAPAAASVVVVVLLSASIVRAQDYRDLQALWTATLARNPQSVAAHNALGVIALEKTNNTPAAFNHFRAALNIDEMNVDTHLNLARLYEETRQNDLALGEYYQALRLDSRRVEAHFGVALVLSRQGDSRAAIQKYREVLSIKPDHKLAYLNLGQLHEERNELDDAVKCYREAIRIDPRLVQARLGLALLLYRLGYINDAADEMKIIIERIDPTNSLAWLNLGAMTGALAGNKELTDPAQKKQLYAQAAEYLRGATFYNPRSAEAFMQRGIVLMKHSQLQPREQALPLISEAIASFRRAGELSSDNPQAIQFAQDAELERQRRQASPDPLSAATKSSPP